MILFVNYYQNDIRNPRGDTYSSTLDVEGLGQDLGGVYFTCKASRNDGAEILFQKKLYDGINLAEYDADTDTRKYSIRISPDDTKSLQSGTYYYDLRVLINQDVFTVMRGLFIIEQDATRDVEVIAPPEEFKGYTVSYIIPTADAMPVTITKLIPSVTATAVEIKKITATEVE